jgi:ElaB/YqjD/DUF883 family membrane-anchored ribosome-binding protein
MKSSKITDELKSAKNGATAMARELNEDAVEMTRSAVKDARHKMDEIESDARGYLKGMEREIKSHPAQSIAIAFAVGVAASLLLGRRMT